MITMMMIRSLRFHIAALTILASLSIHPELYGQVTDFQTRWEAEIEKKVSKNFDLQLSLEQIFRDNSRRYDRSMATLVGQIDLPYGFRLYPGFRWILANISEMNLEHRLRVHVDLKYDIDIHALTVDLRSRTQYGFDDEFYRIPFSENRLVQRFRVKSEYSVFGTRFSVFAGLEPYLHLNDAEGSGFYKFRSLAGSEYDLNQASSIVLTYLYDREFNVIAPLHVSFFWVTYKFSF
jgi:hypothetical protein